MRIEIYLFSAEENHTMKCDYYFIRNVIMFENITTTDVYWRKNNET